jgi:hypothetical protein
MHGVQCGPCENREHAHSSEASSWLASENACCALPSPVNACPEGGHHSPSVFCHTDVRWTCVWLWPPTNHGSGTNPKINRRPSILNFRPEPLLTCDSVLPCAARPKPKPKLRGSLYEVLPSLLHHSKYTVRRLRGRTLPSLLDHSKYTTVCS